MTLRLDGLQLGILNNGEVYIDCGGPNCPVCEMTPPRSDLPQNGNGNESAYQLYKLSLVPP